MDRVFVDLRTLQMRLKEGIEDLFPEKLWVRAEIGQWSPRANGHCYLSLTQSEKG
jgi:exonuclease VII large subunit